MKLDMILFKLGLLLLLTSHIYPPVHGFECGVCKPGYYCANIGWWHQCAPLPKPKPSRAREVEYKKCLDDGDCPIDHICIAEIRHVTVSIC